MSETCAKCQQMGYLPHNYHFGPRSNGFNNEEHPDYDNQNNEDARNNMHGEQLWGDAHEQRQQMGYDRFSRVPPVNNSMPPPMSRYRGPGGGGMGGGNQNGGMGQFGHQGMGGGMPPMKGGTGGMSCDRGLYGIGGCIGQPSGRFDPPIF